MWPVGIGLHVPHWPDRRIRTIIVEMGLDGPLKIVLVRPVRQGFAQIVKGFWSIGMPPPGSRKESRKRMVSKKRKIAKKSKISWIFWIRRFCDAKTDAIPFFSGF